MSSLKISNARASAFSFLQIQQAFGTGMQRKLGWLNYNTEVRRKRQQKFHQKIRTTKPKSETRNR